MVVDNGEGKEEAKPYGDNDVGAAELLCACGTRSSQSTQLGRHAAANARLALLPIPIASHIVSSLLFS